MNIIGLDKIRKIDDNTELEPEVTGLDKIRCDGEGITITGLDSIRHIIESDLPKMSTFAVELIRLVDRAKELLRIQSCDTAVRGTEFRESSSHSFAAGLCGFSDTGRQWRRRAGLWYLFAGTSGTVGLL